MGCSVGSDSKLGGGRSGSHWSYDGKSIYFTATDRGYAKIFKVTVGTREITEVGADCPEYPPVLTSLVMSGEKEESFAFVGGSALNPGEVYFAQGNFR